MRTISMLALPALILSGCASSPITDTNAEKYFQGTRLREVAIAAAHGDIAKIEALKKQGIDIDAQGYEGWTPLLWALGARNKAGYEELLKLGADPNRLDDDHDAVMTAAPTIEDADFLKLALAYGGNPNLEVPNGWPHTPLMAATILGGLENVKLLVHAGANVNYVRSADRVTPAISAAELNQYDIVFYLLENGADYAAEIPTYRGSVNGIVWCIENNNIDPSSPGYQWRQKVIEFLRSKGVIVNPKTP